MKNLLLLALLGMSFQTFAATIDDFIGHYELVKKEGEAFCYKGIHIVEEGDNLAFYRSDFSEWGALVEAPVNGPGRKVSGSHGEAMSSYRGVHKVKFDGNTLLFTDKAIVSVFGVPSGRETESFSFGLTDKGVKLTRKSFEGVAIGIGRSKEATCSYRRR